MIIALLKFYLSDIIGYGSLSEKITERLKLMAERLLKMVTIYRFGYNFTNKKSTFIITQLTRYMKYM